MMTHKHNFQLHLYAASRQGHTKLLSENLSLTKPSCLSFVNHLKAWQMCIGSFRASPLKAFVSLSFTPHFSDTQPYCAIWTYSLALHARSLWPNCYQLGKRSRIIYCNEREICSVHEPYLCLWRVMTCAQSDGGRSVPFGRVHSALPVAEQQAVL